MTADGLQTLPSLYDPSETSARLARYIASHGMSIFARIDHAAGAGEVGLPLRPTEALIYGNAKGGDTADADRPNPRNRPASQGAHLAG